MDQTGLSRRNLLSAGAVLGALATTTGGAAAADVGTSALPRRAEFVVRNAHVLSMDPSVGDFPRADIHVRNGSIVAVGPQLDAPGATIIDGRETIALPGLVDGHNHLWNTPIRSLVRESVRGKGYFPVTLAFGKAYTATDTYRGVLLGVAEMLEGGITTVNDWSHNLRTPEYADADLRALRASGIRARFSYGTYQGGPPPDQPMDVTHLEQLARNWDNAASSDGLLTLGMASRIPANSPRGPANMPVIRADWEAARRIGVPITIHAPGPGLIGVLDRDIGLAPDVQLVHPTGWSAGDLDAIANAKANVCLSPTTDVRMSYGPVAVSELFRRNIIVSLSIDTAGVTGANDLFEEMRLIYAQQCALAHASDGMTPRQILAAATIDGARALGIADRTGSLTPGKRADLILIRTNDLNMAPVGDPVEAVVRSARPQNVDTVIVDGRMLKRNGRLTAIDTAAVVAEARRTFDAVLRQTGLS